MHLRTVAGGDLVVIEGSGLVAVRSLEDLGDADLVRRVERRDEDAFRELFRRYAPVGKALALRVVRQSFLAEEIVQEAFLGIWQQAGSYREEHASVRSWLLSMVHHRAVDCVRREEAQRRRTREQEQVATIDLTGETADVGETVADREELRERRRGVLGALDKLPAEQRQVLEAMYYEGKSQSAIAEATGLPLGTVKSRSMLAMRKLRKELAVKEP